MHTPDSNSHDDKHFELNLVPFIDILSTCICFLLMTTIWIHIGAFNVSQAIGDQAVEDKNPPSVVVQIDDNGGLELSLKDLGPGQKPSVTALAPAGRSVDWAALKNYVTSLRNGLPDLKTALVMPSEDTKYDDVIRVMDTFRQQEITQIGLAPLGGN